MNEVRVVHIVQVMKLEVKLILIFDIKRNAVSFRSADQSNLSNDPLKVNETNPEIQTETFQVSGGSLPTSSKRLTVVTNVDNWHSYSTDPNPEYPMFYTTTAVNYPNFMSNGNAPWSNFRKNNRWLE